MELTLPGFDQITVDPTKLDGQLCIRGPVQDRQMLEFLPAYWTATRSKAEFPLIEADDVWQVSKHAARLARRELYLPLIDSA